jgi:hypothetical protein
MISPSISFSKAKWRSGDVIQEVEHLFCKHKAVMPFTCGTWVIAARRDEGTTESCSIATLMKYTLLFTNSFYTESIWSEKA